MDNVEVPKSFLAETAEYVQATGPRMEKLAQLETELVKHASDTTDALIAAGLAKAENRTATTASLISGGLTKISEAVRQLATAAKPLPRVSFGKAASAESTANRELTADEKWNRGFKLR